MRSSIVLIAATAAVSAAVQAEIVQVEVSGTVEYNQVNFGSLGDVVPGDPFVWSFQVDSDNFVNSQNYNTRGYIIDIASFTSQIGPSTLGLQDPFPGVPYFVIRESDPVADGFFTAMDNVDWPWPDMPLNEAGILGQFAVHCEVGYTGDTLETLDILDAVGTYDYTGLTSFYTVVMDGWAEPVGLEFGQLTISVVGGAVELPLDIKPGSCPNPLNRGSRGLLPMAVLGTMDYDVAMIDESSLRLTRADGVGGEVEPYGANYDDVATPFDGEPCDCHEMGGDGIMDLLLKFKTPDVVQALQLDGMSHGDVVELMSHGDVVELVVTGTLLDGTEFAAYDCIRTVGRNMGWWMMTSSTSAPAGNKSMSGNSFD
jgi:hypothetical protein